MIAAMFLLLAVGCGYLAIRLHAAKVEIADLRANIAQLRRRLNQRP
jgi:cell division protein FtsL